MRENEANLLTKAAAIRRTINLHKTWLEAQLQVPISESVIVEVDIDLSQIGADFLLGSSVMEEVPTRTLRRLRTFIADAELPRRFPPFLEFSLQSARDDYSEIFVDERPAQQPCIHWGDAPLVLRLKVGGTIFAVANIPYFDGPAACHESIAHIVVTRRSRAHEVLRVIAHVARRDQQPRIRVQDGPTRLVARCEWEDLVLDQSVLTLLRDDFEAFFERTEWYRSNRLPHRRGYLLHGEPGNGKTSMVRAMLTSRGLTAYTMRFFDPRSDDGDVDRLFDWAYRNRPAIVLLEDVDRIFPKTGGSKSNLSTQNILNALDGVGTVDDIVVIATANRATELDGAILRRPGRFDRVVHFARPVSELRKKYLLKFSPGLDPSSLEQPVVQSDGFSFAQLREAVILGGQRAFEHKRDVDAEDLLYAICTLRQTTAQGDRHPRAAGFNSSDGTVKV